ncbi:MAG TPA: hypothetical protein VF485_00495 [Sphingomonas sp.]
MTATTERRFRSRDWCADPIRSDKTARCSLAPSHTPLEELYRVPVGQLADGACLDFAVDTRRIAGRTPRHSH